MSSTNKTAHYSLSQYVANDKPTYLSDYNSDMAKIDAAIYAAKSAADTAETTASGLAPTVSENETNIGELQTDMRLVKSTQATQGNSIESLQEFMGTTTGTEISTKKVTINPASNNSSTINSSNVTMKTYDLFGLKLTSIFGEIRITPTGTQHANAAFAVTCPEIIARIGSGRKIYSVGTVNTATSSGPLSLELRIQDDTITAVFGSDYTPTKEASTMTLEVCLLD